MASGITYDYLSTVTGAEIDLGVIALPDEVLNEAYGATEVGAFTYDKTNDISVNFAFGYYAERRDGSFVYYWHPICMLVHTDEKFTDKGDATVDPNISYKIKVIPTTEGIWRVRYDTAKALTTNNPLTPAEFFAKAIYDDEDAPEETEKT